jgi:glycosyltransferase involved in cell wall biosynthesis
VRAIWRLARLLITLRALRRRGKRVVWTIHNIKPHETRHRLLEALGPWATARIADALIVHSRYAGQRVAEGLGGANKLHVIPHGPFVELYPPASRRRTEVRAAIGLPDDAFTYLVFGQLRAYKLIPETIRAFRSLPDVNVRLVVAGIARHHDVREQIASVAAGDERVMLRFGYVPDDEVAELHLAADAAVLAYRELFSSGALVLALGFGLPVVAPRRGTAAEIADGPALETFEPCRLRSALAAVRNGDRAERRRAAFAAVEHFDWDSIASDTIRVYRGERPPDL